MRKHWGRFADAILELCCASRLEAYSVLFACNTQFSVIMIFAIFELMIYFTTAQMKTEFCIEIHNIQNVMQTKKGNLQSIFCYNRPEITIIMPTVTRRILVCDGMLVNFCRVAQKATICTYKKLEG